MIKKLDKLILRAFIGPFFATFFLAIFVLILQFFWLWIDEFVGKGMDVLSLLQLVSLVALSWVPVALPLAMLLSTIMTFGNLGESYELVAIKSAGISLQRFMRPVLVVAVIVSVVAFLFNNNVIPVINLKLNKMKFELVYTKPAFDIKPGVFYDKIEGFVIKLGNKKDDGTIYNVIIYDRSNSLQDNTLLADSGRMTVSKDKRYLSFRLMDGVRYEERGPRNEVNTDLITVNFKEYTKEFDISSFFKVQGNDSMFKDNYKMLSVRQLNGFLDSIRRREAQMDSAVVKNIQNAFHYGLLIDSGKFKAPAKDIKFGKKILLFPDTLNNQLAEGALSKISGAKSVLEFNIADIKNVKREERYFDLTRHQKYSMSFACLVLFLIGAPLGAIIRKGGLGSPLVFAVIFFVLFHLFNTLGEKMGKEGVVTPWLGAWLPNIILLPVGLFLTYKAMRDSQLFNKEFYNRVWKKIQVILPFLKKNKKRLSTA